MRATATYPRLLVASLLFGCGDNHGPPCQSSDIYAGDADAACLPALVFAARDTNELVPSQTEVDRYYDRWRRVVDAEPILGGVYPQVRRLQAPGFMNSFQTTNAHVIAAWSAAKTHDRVSPTGDLRFDQIMDELGEPFLAAKGYDRGDGVFLFAVVAGVVFNEELLHARLMQVSSALQEPVEKGQSDGLWSWAEGQSGTGDDTATAQIEFRFGFYDCFSGCGGFRYLRAIASASGDATVYDLGGDPLPPNMHLSPNTRPPP
jgi:hypothetical protein